jgi:hypothetical protein
MRPHLAFAQGASGLHYAFSSATLDVTPPRPNAPPDPTGGEYNPLDPCPEDSSQGSSSLDGTRQVAAQLSRVANHGNPLDDLGIFEGMTGLFSATPAGQSYIELYRQHGAEMGRTGLGDPQLLWDAYGTLQNFMPGLEALVTGHGDEMVVTQEMVDDALSIWTRLASSGSPALSAAINAELVQYNNLQDFVGMTFDGWAEAIGVNPPPESVYLPLLRR